MAPDGAAASPRPALLAELPERLHHHAYVVRDHEANRRFFEDVLGMPLVATWCENATVLGRPTAMCHTFFGMADGGALAFFQFADPEVYRLTQTDARPAAPNFDHIALKVSQPTYDEIVARVKAAGLAIRELDHGFCRSCYCQSPDGLAVEFTVDAADAAEIDARRRADAHGELARWLGGDHRVNNELRPDH